MQIAVQNLRSRKYETDTVVISQHHDNAMQNKNHNVKRSFLWQVFLTGLLD